MSVINKALTNEQVIPVIESDLFKENSESRFAVGVLAIRDQALLGLESEYSGYFDLRRRVYVDQTGQLDESDIQEDGTDRDIDDGRSIAFGIVENRGVDQRVVAATRLIIKGFNNEAGDNTIDRPLPVEEFCPEIFEDTPAPNGSLEVSRLIIRHEKAAIQQLLTWKMYSVALNYIDKHDLGPTYAVIEPWLERYFNATIPVSRIGEPRYIEHYCDYNLPIEVHTDEFVKVAEARDPKVMDTIREADGSMAYFGKLRQPSISKSSAA